MEHSFDILKQTKIKHIMNRQVVTINADDEFSEVQIKFTNDHVTHVVVIDSDKKVVGLISQKYLYRTQSPRKVVNEEMEYRPDLLRDGDDTFYTKEMLNSYILSHIMQKKPFCLLPEDTLAEAILHMANKKLSCIPIVDKENKIQGTLSHFEMINFLSRFC